VHQPKLGTDGNRVASGLNWSRKCATPHGHLARANSSPGSDARDGRRTSLVVANRRPWWAMTTPAPCSAGVRRREYGAEAVRRVCRRERAVTERDVGTNGDRGGVLSSTGEDVVGLRGRRTSGELGGGLLTSTCGELGGGLVTSFGSPSLDVPGGSHGGVAVPVESVSLCVLRALLESAGRSIGVPFATLGGVFSSSLLDVSTIQRSRQCTVECTRRTMSPVKNEY